MKKIISIVAIVALLFSNATLAQAVDTEEVAITITLNHSEDIEVGGSADLTVVPGTPDVGGSITVKNVGTGIEETIRLTDVTEVPADWTLQFQFTATDVKPEAGDANWSDASTISEPLAHDITKYLWIRLGAPNPTGLTTLAISATITTQ